jgi:hypothetical protein
MATRCCCPPLSFDAGFNAWSFSPNEFTVWLQPKF